MTHIDRNSLKHFSINAVLALLLGVFGIGVGLGASLTKEWCDNTFYGHWCWWDITFDLLGVIVGFALHCLILIAAGV